ncbi:magnesium/cobalt transporter CorA [Alsobacter sp. SYSU M60028]|uniref:Magnesium transport protein CorA n=1 Tax=Alsobacter ponti TaxID=2962936 RepID=A0ABT1LD83_9HYPH|nr:magnesium/cobalt transporter CorA [Alsobacter ponti]MCP8939043.1 magnesium/cobalt transporter CorA [Alsobacter ponti]
MIIVHRVTGAPPGASPFERRVLERGEPIPEDVIWIDLIEPTPAEDKQVEAFLRIAIPTREEMSDIEPSELLYTEDGARYMTARVVHNVDVDPEVNGITFILRDRVLVTVRYSDPKAFQMFTNRISRPDGCAPTAEAIMSGLFETIIDRAADVLQATGARLDRLGDKVFESKSDPKGRSAEFQETLRALGRHGDIISKIRESLVSLERVLLFLSVSYRTARVPLELREAVKTTLRDLQSLEEHATFQSQKIQFLLDATLGLVNLEQNNIIKLFSVVAVIFMPPTLVASIYGMNFRTMPELDWTLGYPMAVGIMVLAGLLPYLFFRWKRWL